MTDQPPTNHSDQEPTTDQPADKSGVVGDQPSTDHDDAPVLVSLEEAAAQLGISINAVRQRIKRHTVAAVKTDAGWLVDMVATNQRPTTNRPTNQPTDQLTGRLFDATDQQATTDLSPLAEVIHEQNRRNEKQAERIAELSAAVGMWQARAMHLEEQLQQLTATVESTDEAAQSPQSDATDDQTREHQHEKTETSVGMWARLRRIQWDA